MLLPAIKKGQTLEQFKSWLQDCVKYYVMTPKESFLAYEQAVFTRQEEEENGSN